MQGTQRKSAAPLWLKISGQMTDTQQDDNQEQVLACASSLIRGHFEPEASLAADASSSAANSGAAANTSTAGLACSVADQRPGVRFGMIHQQGSSDFTAEEPRRTKTAPEPWRAPPSHTPSSSFKSFKLEASRSSRILKSQFTVNNLMSMEAPVGKEMDTPEDFGNGVEATRKRLHDISRRTVNPRSPFVRMWDSVTVIALLYVAFVTPFEVAFIEGDGSAATSPVTFTLNRLIDAVFVGDVVLTFFLPYREANENGGMMVYDNKKIARAYLRGWFALDVFTCIPFDVIVAAFASSGLIELDAQVMSTEED